MTMSGHTNIRFYSISVGTSPSERTGSASDGRRNFRVVLADGREIREGDYVRANGGGYRFDTPERCDAVSDGADMFNWDEDIDTLLGPLGTRHNQTGRGSLVVHPLTRRGTTQWGRSIRPCGGQASSHLSGESPSRARGSRARQVRGKAS
jgi:hypothetical protein